MLDFGIQAEHSYKTLLVRLQNPSNKTLHSPRLAKHLVAAPSRELCFREDSIQRCRRFPEDSVEVQQHVPEEDRRGAGIDTGFDICTV